MEYKIGKIGRIIAVKLSDGEDVYETIEKVARKEDIKSAAVIAVGGIKKAKVVVGPEDPTGKIIPMFQEFDDAREVVGVGTIFWDEAGPKLHIHMGFGRKDKTLIGCPRGGANVFCILEVIIFEIENVNGIRELDKDLGIKLLSLK